MAVSYPKNLDNEMKNFIEEQRNRAIRPGNKNLTKSNCPKGSKVLFRPMAPFIRPAGIAVSFDSSSCRHVVHHREAIDIIRIMMSIYFYFFFIFKSNFLFVVTTRQTAGRYFLCVDGPFFFFIYFYIFLDESSFYFTTGCRRGVSTSPGEYSSTCCKELGGLGGR